MEYIYPITALSHTGESVMLHTERQAGEFLRTHRVGVFWNGVINYWQDYSKERRRPQLSDLTLSRYTVIEYDWIMRDDWGRVVKPQEVALPSSPYDHHRKARRAASLGLPIPCTGKRRRWHRNSSWSKKGKNGAYNQAKGLKLYEDGLITSGHYQDL